MSRFPIPFTALAAALALLGCAAPSTPQPAGPQVRPVQSVRHGIDAQTAYRTGRYFQGQVRFDDALESYRQALAVQPDHVDALNALGVIHSLQDRPEQAERAFRAALAAAPQSAQVHNNLGYHLMRTGRLAEAVMAFEQARAIEPGNEFAAVNLAAARAELGLAPEAAVAAVAAPAPAPASASASATATATAVAAPVVAEAPTSAPPAALLDRVGEGVWNLRAASDPPAITAPPPAQVAAAIEVYPRSAAAPAVARAPAQPGRLEIANGNGVTGLARRLSMALAPQGFERARLTNEKPFNVATSRIQYVAGAERMARDLNATLPVQLPLAQVAQLERNARVRIVLGKDFPPQAAATGFSTRSNS